MGARTGREGALTASRAAGAMFAAAALSAGALFASTLAYPAPAASAKGATSGAALIVKTEHVAKLGTVLTTGAGLTLYSYGVDPAGQATCTGACAKAWPPLLLPKGVARIKAPHGVKGLTAIRVKGGRLQVFFHDHALYRFVSDTKKGEATGQGVEDEWFAVLSDGKSSAVTSGLPRPPPVAEPRTRVRARRHRPPPRRRAPAPLHPRRLCRPSPSRRRPRRPADHGPADHGPADYRAADHRPADDRSADDGASDHDRRRRRRLLQRAGSVSKFATPPQPAGRSGPWYGRRVHPFEAAMDRRAFLRRAGTRRRRHWGRPRWSAPPPPARARPVTASLRGHPPRRRPEARRRPWSPRRGASWPECSRDLSSSRATRPTRTAHSSTTKCSRRNRPPSRTAPRRSMSSVAWPMPGTTASSWRLDRVATVMAGTRRAPDWSSTCRRSTRCPSNPGCNSPLSARARSWSTCTASWAHQVCCFPAVRVRRSASPAWRSVEGSGSSVGRTG